MSTIDKSKFSLCIFNPMDEDFPLRAARLMAISHDEVKMKFIVAMFDPKSPLRITYPEFEIRKNVAAQLFDYDVPARLLWLDKEMVQAIVEFLKIVNNRKWAIIVSIEQTIWEYSQTLLNPVMEPNNGHNKESMSILTSKNQIAESMMSLNESLDALITTFYGSPELEEAVVNNGMRLTPEVIAARIKNN